MVAHTSDKAPLGYLWRSSKLFIVAAVSMAMFSDSFLFSYIIPIFPALLHDRLQIPDSRAQFVISAVLSMNALVSIPLAPVTGYLSDRISSKNDVMIGSYIINLVGTAITAWSPTVTGVIIGRLIQAISGSMIWITGMAILGNSVGVENLSKAFGLCVLFVSAGHLSGPALAGVLYDSIPYSIMWLPTFLVLAVGLIMQALLIEPSTTPRKSETGLGADLYPSESDEEAESLLPPGPVIPQVHHYHSIGDFPDPPPRQPASSWYIYWSMLSKRRVTNALIADVLFAILIGSFEATIPMHVREVFHWESLGAGMSFLLLQAPSLVLVIPAGWLKDRYGMRMPVTIGFILMAPSLWLLGVPGNSNFGWADGEKAGQTIYILTLVVIGACRTSLLGFGGVEVLNGANELAAEQPGIFGSGTGYSRASAMSNISWKLGLFLGPLLSGLLTGSIGYYMMNIVLAILCFIMGVTTYLAYWRA
ncbi:MFS general substrate transporter [Aspergillus karnatakaensis]|uniref:MFS general substrate transporter n=1 Tax=Aspergillus karnatakaensis TaxID=1810916 RepID=UPI003CCDD056